MIFFTKKSVIFMLKKWSVNTLFMLYVVLQLDTFNTIHCKQITLIL